MTLTIGPTITIPNQRTDNGVPVERPVREGSSMGQFTMLEEDKAVEEMAVVPSADLADHQMAEAVPLVEVATEMEIGRGDVLPNRLLQKAAETWSCTPRHTS